MREDIPGNLPDVLGNHVITARQECMSPGGRTKMHRGPRRRPVANDGSECVRSVGWASAPNQIQQVALNLRIDPDQTQGDLGRRETSSIDDSVRDGRGSLQPALQHLQFLVAAWIVDTNLHQEPIELRFRQRIGPFVLDGVLRGEDEKGFTERVGRVANGHTTLLHGLEKGALHLCGCAIDLVRQDQVGEHRAFVRFEGARPRVVDEGAGDVSRQQVRRELDAPERERQRSRDRLDRQGLGEPRHALDENVAIGQESDEETIDQPRLADDDLPHLVSERVEAAAGRFSLHVWSRPFTRRRSRTGWP